METSVVVFPPCLPCQSAHGSSKMGSDQLCLASYTPRPTHILILPGSEGPTWCVCLLQSGFCTSVCHQHQTPVPNWRRGLAPSRHPPMHCVQHAALVWGMPLNPLAPLSPRTPDKVHCVWPSAQPPICLPFSLRPSLLLTVPGSLAGVVWCTCCCQIGTLPASARLAASTARERSTHTINVRVAAVPEGKSLRHEIMGFACLAGQDWEPLCGQHPLSCLRGTHKWPLV